MNPRLRERHSYSFELKGTALRHGCEHENRFWTCFYGSKSPLSNMYQTIIRDPFTDKQYRSSEAMYQARKAEFFGDKALAERIRNAPTAYQSKRLGQTVPGFDLNTWRRHAPSIMLDILKLKFGQNERLKHYLLHFTKSWIAESSKYDNFYGTGIHIQDEDCLNPTRWTGRNMMGLILQEVRYELSDTK